MTEKLIDPAEQKTKEVDEKLVEERILTLDDVNLKDFTSMDVKYEKAMHPFDGYPLEDIVLGEGRERILDSKGKPKKDKNGAYITKKVIFKTKKSFIVALPPNKHIPQDRSGEAYGVETWANVLLVDYENGQTNIHAYFDRKLKIGDTVLRCAIVPSHSARSQLFFKIDAKTGKIRTTQEYMLLDGEQKSRLRKTFDAVMGPQFKAIRDSKEYSGEGE